MKRKDWKIKKLKEDSFGKNIIKKNKYIFKKKSRKFLRLIKVKMFLRKLLLRKYKNLVRRNLILNYFFYQNLLKNFSYKKNKYYNYIFFKKIGNNAYLPAFLFKKKVFNFFNRFKKIQKKFNFDYFFFNTIKKVEKKNYIKTNQDFGLKISIQNFKLFEELNSFINEDDNKNIFFEKEKNIYFMDHYNFNFFFNFNLHQNCIIEIYKIIIILYLNKFN